MARRGNLMTDRSPFGKVQAERMQMHSTRTALYNRLGKELGRPVVSFFTSHRWPGVMIQDDDASMLESVLQEMDLARGLVLIVNSPGGSGLAAERVINMCRAYSGTGEYWVLVPEKAKSAATMICMGASKVIMGPSSELGPIDPQWGPSPNGIVFSLPNVVKTYEQLLARAVRTKGRIEPLLQQLRPFDAREIQEFRSAIALSEDIAVRALKSGMMAGSTEAAIKKRIGIFCNPENTKSHGRPIYRDEAGQCGLVVDAADVTSEMWRTAYELFIRLDNVVSGTASKAIENEIDGHSTPVPLDVFGGESE
jgi:hypothetical protein